MGRTAVLGAAGALIAGTLIAGTVTAPAAEAKTARADSRHHDRAGAEAYGVRIAAERAARTGIAWKDCPKDWGLPAPSSAGG